MKRLALLALAAVPLAAQAPAWSPLGPTADLPRGLVTAPAFPEFLLAPHAPLGLFWSLSNPGAVASDLGEAYSAYRIGRTHTSGDYRRPLDLISSTGVTASAETWGKVTDKFAAAGRVALDVVTADPSSYAQELFPYGSSPLAEADTSTSGLRRPAARLEGALGWQLGGWGVGFAAAYEGVDNRTGETRLPRFGHAAFPAGSLGLVRALGFGGITLGARLRYGYGYEQLRVISHGADGTVYDIEGLADPQVRPVSTASPYYRKYVRHATGVQLSATGALLGGTWLAAAERLVERERQTSREQANPPWDVWRADGWRYDFAARRALPRIGELTGRVSRVGIHGTSELASVTGIFYIADESELRVGGDFRLALPDTLALLGVTVETRHRVRRLQDFLALRQASLDVWEPGVSVTAGTWFAGRAWGEVSASVAGHYAAASIPDPDSTSVLYQLYVAPDLSLDATQARVMTLRAALRNTFTSAFTAWLELRYEKATPTGAAVSHGPVPPADRSRLGVFAGVVVGL